MRRIFKGLASAALSATFGVLVVFQGAATGAPAKTNGSDVSSAAVSKAQLMSQLRWRSIGPYIGGRVITVAGVAQKPNLFYMGGVDAGVWKSTDYGLRWKNISDKSMHAPDMSIGAIAVAPSDPKVIYIGTGEHDIRGDVITGDGLYKSSNGGKTWKHIGLKETHTISKIVVDPDDANTVYVAALGHVFAPNAERGVYKSTDGGKNWRKVLYVNKKTGAIDLAMDPHHPDTLYASMWQAYRVPGHLSSGGPGSGLYKSTDGGSHWSNISRNSGLPKEVLGRVGVAVASNHPNVVYTIMQAKDGGVFRSHDGGKSWHRVNKAMKIRQRAFYYMRIFVDPTDVNTVYVPEVEALFVSHNGGKKFKKLKTPHGDNHVVWVNPKNPKVMLEGNDGGATVTTDGGKTWSSVHNQPTGQYYHVNLDNQFPYHVYGAQQDEGSFEGPSATGAGSIPLQDWRRVAYGESTFTVPQPGHPNITYGSGYYTIFLKYNATTEQYHDISPWPDYQDGVSSAELKYRFGWTHPILFSPNNHKDLFIGAQFVLKSTDHGRSWQRISPDLTRNNKKSERPSGGPVDLDQSGAEVYPIVNALAVSPLDNNLIWAGSDDGLTHVTTDGGKHWKNVTPKTLPKQIKISSIEPSHTKKGTAYLTARRYMWDDFKPYVFKTTDYGKHWTPITKGLPRDQYVFALRQDPHDADLLFLCTRNTVYVSLNGGNQWIPLELNLPHVQVRDIAIQPQQNQAVVATHGRGFWVLDHLALLRQLTKNPSVSGDTPYLFRPQLTWLTKSYGKGDRIAPTSGENPKFGATVFFNLPSDYDGQTSATLQFASANGKKIRSFKLHLKKQAKNKNGKANEKRTTIEHDSKTKSTEKEKKEKKTAVEPGMNRFQWDLRSGDTVKVKAFHAPGAAGGLSSALQGPEVVPGKYYAILKYKGKTVKRAFQVKLDPRLSASRQDLVARQHFLSRIQAKLDHLDSVLNKAIPLRKNLRKAVQDGNLSSADAQRVLTTLNQSIGETVQLNIHSNEGDLLHETKLHSRLGALASAVEHAYVRPTKAEHDVFNMLSSLAEKYGSKLQKAVKTGRGLLSQSQ